MKLMTPAEQTIADLLFRIAELDENAQDAEDREDYRRASEHRARARALKSELAALRAATSGLGGES